MRPEKPSPTRITTEEHQARGTAERWLSRYRAAGLIGLARTPRTDGGRPRLAEEFVHLIEGLYLKKPRPSVTAIHRRVAAIARERKLPIPAYSSVHAIVSALDPAMVTLAHEGHAAYRDRFGDSAGNGLFSTVPAEVRIGARNAVYKSAPSMRASVSIPAGHARKYIAWGAVSSVTSTKER
jgi:hypothetical protein